MSICLLNKEGSTYTNCFVQTISRSMEESVGLDMQSKHVDSIGKNEIFREKFATEITFYICYETFNN